MKWLLIGLLALGGNMPLLTDTTVKADKMLVYVQVEANPDNSQVTVAVTALDNTPPEWASATVYHVWYIDPVDMRFIDTWPNMRAGHFRVKVTLQRGKDVIQAPSQDVEIP